MKTATVLIAVLSILLAFVIASPVEQRTVSPAEKSAASPLEERANCDKKGCQKCVRWCFLGCSDPWQKAVCFSTCHHNCYDRYSCGIC